MAYNVLPFTRLIEQFERLPGIGKKTAQRLVLELKDKVDDEQLTGGGAAVTPKVASAGPEAEAVAALTALGYSGLEAAQAVSRVAGQASTLDELIRFAGRVVAANEAES